MKRHGRGGCTTRCFCTELIFFCGDLLHRALFFPAGRCQLWHCSIAVSQCIRPVFQYLLLSRHPSPHFIPLGPVLYKTSAMMLKHLQDNAGLLKSADSNPNRCILSSVHMRWPEFIFPGQQRRWWRGRRWGRSIFSTTASSALCWNKHGWPQSKPSGTVAVRINHQLYTYYLLGPALPIHFYYLPFIQYSGALLVHEFRYQNLVYRIHNLPDMKKIYGYWDIFNWQAPCFNVFKGFSFIHMAEFSDTAPLHCIDVIRTNK